MHIRRVMTRGEYGERSRDGTV
jgi:HTH-type transcriptional regulator/antitoxin HigA